MDYLNARVHHKKYGYGIITAVGGNEISVLFDEGEMKKFQSPSCFEKFITIVDSNLNDYAKQEVEDYLIVRAEEEAEEKERRRIEAERMRRARSYFAIQKSNTDSFVRRLANVPDFVNCYSDAINKEIETIKSNGGKRILLTDGKYIGSEKTYCLYSFDADSELFFPDGTDIMLFLDGRRYNGTVIACEDYTLTISSPVSLGKNVPKLEISAQPWHLLKMLCDRLDEIKYNHSAIVDMLVCEGYGNIDSGIIKTGQDMACVIAEEKPVSFIWGPPGTGKTETLAKIAVSFMKKNKRVLMLSYSNVSVDGAALRVRTLMEKQNRFIDGEIIRYGFVRDKALCGKNCISSYEYAIKHHPYYPMAKALSEALKTADRSTKRYVDMKKRLKEFRDDIKPAETMLAKTAKFVATTVSKAVVDQAIYEQSFDVVIFDEASMAYIPQVIYSSSLAKEHFICMGDFSQLPPIVQCKENPDLEKDIFDYCGITDSVNQGYNHNWLCMLDVQYRMHPEIAGFAGKNMYCSMLKSAQGMDKNRLEIVNDSPLKGYPLSLIDLSNTISFCTKTSDYSRINPLSALLTFGLALIAAKNHHVGIISPYSAQSRLYRAFSRDASNAFPELKPITCATVHQFQGSEKDIIFFDSVDCYVQKMPGLLLSSKKNNEANRLFNVAMTRAKGKFVCVSNSDYTSSHLSSSFMLRKFISYCKYHGFVADDSIYKKEYGRTFEKLYKVFDDRDDYQQFFDDISAAKESVFIDIPGQISNRKDFKEKLSRSVAGLNYNVEVRIRCESIESLPYELVEYSDIYDYLYNPVTIIDKKIVWYGLPSTTKRFTTKDGKNNKIIFRPVIRIEGKRTAVSLYNFLKMNKRKYY